MQNHASTLAAEFKLDAARVAATVALIDEGNTIPFQGTILREGDESEVVRVLQEYLNYIAACIPEVPSTSPTGYFGSRTRASVEAIQRAYGLPVTGYVNAITWRYITDLYSDLYVGNRLNQGQYPGFTVG